MTAAVTATSAPKCRSFWPSKLLSQLRTISPMSHDHVHDAERQ